MEWFAGFYAGMAALTALVLILDVPPRSLGQWLAFVGIALIWPVAFAYALYCAIVYEVA